MIFYTKDVELMHDDLAFLEEETGLDWKVLFNTIQNSVWYSCKFGSIDVLWHIEHGMRISKPLYRVGNKEGKSLRAALEHFVTTLRMDWEQQMDKATALGTFVQKMEKS